MANFGHNQFYSNWTYIPARDYSSAPFGFWSVKTAIVLTSYFNGTDPCVQAGVICQDDVALLVLNPQNGHYAGNYTGWLGYGWNGYSYFPWQSLSQALIAQLGYPCGLDSCQRMQRTDSLGYNAGSDWSNNTIIGSLMNGGSSGGPWIVNIGVQPVLSGGLTQGSMAAYNIVVGVTSWGFINQAIKQQGAAPFTSTNILVLVNAVCTNPSLSGAC